MRFLIPVLLLTGSATAFKIEDVASYLPLLRVVQPRACPPNEMWQPCARNCSDCERRGSCHVTADDDDECQPGCDCVPHFFRVEPGGPCVPVASCPRPSECGAEEVFRECGPVCERCGVPRCRLISCEHRCYCKQGRLRDGGRCVPQELCPDRSKCGHNEEWSEEGGPAKEYCGDEAEGGGRQEAPGCYCKQGHRRSAFGSCVRRCPSSRCFGMSRYLDCVPRCNVTCYSDPGCEEDGNCYPGCFCRPGYVMNPFNVCIRSEECTRDIPEVKVIRGSGIMVEEESEATPTEEGTTTPGSTEPSKTDGTTGGGLRTSAQTESTRAETTTEDFEDEDNV